MRAYAAAGALALGAIFLCWESPRGQARSAAALPASPPAFDHAGRGNRDYFAGEPKKSIANYQAALQENPHGLAAWLNGAVVWNELGSLTKAAEWYGRAAELSPRDAKILTALGEVSARLGRLEDARRELRRACDADPRDTYALAALGRVELADGRPAEAQAALAEAIRLDPNLTLAHFYLGRAREISGDDPGAADAYKSAAFGDSYFTLARYQFTRALVRLRRFHEAWDQIDKLVSTAPWEKNFRSLERDIRPRLRDSPRPVPAAPAAPAGVRAPKLPLPMTPPPAGKVPMLRVGIATTGMGRPLGWHGFSFTCKSRFSIYGKASGKVYARGEAGKTWQLAVTPNRFLELKDDAGKRLLLTRGSLVLRTDLRRGGWTVIRELSGGRVKSGKGLSRTLRGLLEVSLPPGQSGASLVNVVDLESYTQGVLAAEMPIGSPMEALKAQAVIARTHALFMKRNRGRHRQDGYDLCDGQHCQVYNGVGSETERAREIVRATSGRVISYEGRISDVLYSSNCGGHSQSAGDISGWGAVPYFSGVKDGGGELPAPDSPWGLRLWLRGAPRAYCRPSAYVYPAHFRWTRVIPAPDLEARINRSLKLGRLVRIVPLKRAPSGHLNSILVEGSRGRSTVSSEMSIRGLFGVGSQRSSLFVLDTEYDASGRPESFVFHGGGWGHGVGMCQSGAMGRAEAGQSYPEILQAYFKGIEIGNLEY